MNKYRRIVMVVVLSGACLFLGWKVFGQIYDKDVPPPQLRLRGMSPQDLQLMRQDLRKQKQTLIAQNLRMTESEAIKFWAIYQKYSEELREINDEKFAMLYSYAQNWPSMSDHDALIFTRRWLELDEKVVQLRSRYFPLVRDVLPGKKAATFYQLDERISMMINLEFASQLPLLKGATGYQKTFEASQ